MFKQVFFFFFEAAENLCMLQWVTITMLYCNVKQAGGEKGAFCYHFIKAVHLLAAGSILLELQIFLCPGSFVCASHLHIFISSWGCFQLIKASPHIIS